MISINTLPAGLCRNEIQDIIRSNITLQKSNGRELQGRKVLSNRLEFLHKLSRKLQARAHFQYNFYSEKIITMLPNTFLNTIYSKKVFSPSYIEQG